MYFCRPTKSCVNTISGASGEGAAAFPLDVEGGDGALGSTGSAGSAGGEGNPAEEGGDGIRKDRRGVIPVKPPRPSCSIRAQAAGS